MRSVSFRLAASVFVSLLVLASTGCGTRVEYTPTNTPPRPLTPRAPESVEVITVSQSTRPFVEVAILEARQESGFSLDAPPEVIAKLRKEAGQRGCDAIVMTGSADEVQGSTMRGTGSTETLKGYRATCIVYR